MSYGRLRLITSGPVDGIVKVDVISVGQVLGGVHSSPRHKLYYLVPFQGEAEVGDSFVELFAYTRRPEMTRWRIWFDGVAVTREYKPNYTIPQEKGEYSVTIINVTPLARRNPQRSKHKLVVVNEGSEPIELLGSMMVKTYLTGRGSAWLTYSTGGLSLPEEASATVPGVENPPSGEMSIYSTPLARSTPLHLTLACGGSSLDYNQVSKVGELKATLPPCRELVIENRMGGPAVFPSIVAVSQSYDRPEPRLENIEVTRTMEGVELRVTVSNRGSVELDRAMLTLFALGESVARSEVGKLAPGGFTTIQVKARLPRDVRTVVVRLIWSEYGEPRFVERKVGIE